MLEWLKFNFLALLDAELSKDFAKIFKFWGFSSVRDSSFRF